MQLHKKDAEFRKENLKNRCVTLCNRISKIKNVDTP